MILVVLLPVLSWEFQFSPTEVPQDCGHSDDAEADAAAYIALCNRLELAYARNESKLSVLQWLFVIAAGAVLAQAGAWFWAIT